MLAYIPDDSYTELFYIEGVPGMFPAVRGEFKPVSIAARAKHRRESVKITDDEQQDPHAAGLMAAKLIRWNIDGLDCRKRDDVLKLKDRLFVKLFAIVLGDIPSDVDPDWNADEKARYENTAVQLLEGDAKN